MALPNGIGPMIGSLAPYFGGPGAAPANSFAPGGVSGAAGVNGGQPSLVPSPAAVGVGMPGPDFASFCRARGVSPPPQPGSPMYASLMEAFVQYTSSKIAEREAKAKQLGGPVGAEGYRP